MKFGKITSQKVSHDALSLGGALAGGALSGGLMTLVPADQKLYVRGGMVLTGLLGAASVKGATSAENAVKFALLGIGVRQAAELIKHFGSKSVTVDENSTSSEKFVAGTLGLACPCEDTPALAAPTINFAALKGAMPMPQIDSVYQDPAAVENTDHEIMAGAF